MELMRSHNIRISENHQPAVGVIHEHGVGVQRVLIAHVVVGGHNMVHVSVHGERALEAWRASIRSTPLVVHGDACPA